MKYIVASEIEAAKMMTYNAARLKEEGKPFVMEAAMAKFVAAKVAERATSYAVEWMGGNGFVRETGVEKFYRDAKIGSIYEGKVFGDARSFFLAASKRKAWER